MIKSLTETYNKMIKEGAAPRPLPKPISPVAPVAKPLGGTSSSGTSSIVSSAQPSQQKIDSSRSLQNKTLQPGTNQTTANPMPMGGSVPGRTVGSTMVAARSSNMQGRPAGSPTSPINVNRTVTSTGNPNVAGGIKPVQPATSQNAGFRKSPPGGFLSPQAAQAAGQNWNIGSTGGIVSRPAATGQKPGLDRTIPKSPVVPNQNMKGSPLDQTQGARPEVSRDYRLNQMRQNPPALDAKRDSTLDQPQTQSPMARATNPNVGGAGGGDYKSAQKPSVVSTGNPNAAGGARTPTKAPIPKPKPGQPVQSKSGQPVQKQRVKPTAPVNVAKPTIDREAKRRVLAGKEGVGPEGNKMRQRSGVKLGARTGSVTGKIISNKQLSEMIKTVRKKNILEQISGMGKFKGGSGDIQDYSGPNRVVNKASKEQHHIKEVIGPTHAASLQKRTGVINKTPAGRAKFQGGNQKRSVLSYTSEASEEDLGTTDTGKKGKEAETISVNPKDNTASATGSINKNTTIKENKEK